MYLVVKDINLIRQYINREWEMSRKRIVALLTLSSIMTLSFIPMTHAETATTYYNLPSMKFVIFYYGWLDTSDVVNYKPNILVFSAATGSEKEHYRDVVNMMLSKGVEVYGYIHDGNVPIGLGSTFNKTVVTIDPSCPDNLVTSWIKYIEIIVDNVTSSYPGINIFLDEVDPNYFGTSNPDDPCLQKFTSSVEEIVGYIHSKGLKVMINGARAYAGLGDYYLWEGFYQYAVDNYYYTDTVFFMESDNGNPYEWENGYGKYLWLRDNGLINKTIALSFKPKLGTQKGITSYLLAKALRLTGWGITTADIYASGGALYVPRIVPVGKILSDPVFDYDNGTVEFYTLYGKFTLKVANETYVLPPTISWIKYVPMIDGIEEEWYQALVGQTDGSSSRINYIEYLYSSNNLFIYISGTWTGGTASVLYHIYIDNDANSSTGFKGTGLSIGAEYLIEIYDDTTVAYMYRYSGTGYGWSWEFERTLPLALRNDGSNIYAEIELYTDSLSDNAMFQVTTVDSSYNDDAVTWVLNLPDIVENAETLYPPLMLDASQYLENIPIVLDSYIGRDRVSITIDYQTGYALYQFTVPFQVKSVVKNGNELLPSDPNEPEYWYILSQSPYYTTLQVRVKHASPVTIDIYPRPVQITAEQVLGGETREIWPMATLIISIAFSIVVIYTILTTRNPR